MSNYKVISAVGETLKQLLLSAMKNDSAVYGTMGILKSEDQITLDHPHGLIGDGEPNANALSIFLYRVLENGEVKNRPLTTNGTGTKLQFPPLPVNLYYLITPITNSADNNHRLLGKVMQILFDNGMINGSALQGVLKGTAEELRIVLNPVSMEDVTKLWSSFMKPYQLSVTYEVKVLYIDSERETNVEQVRRKRMEFTQL